MDEILDVGPLTWEGLSAQLLDKLTDWLEELVRLLPNLVLAALVLVLAWLVSIQVRRLVRSTLGRVSKNVQLNHLAAGIARLAVVLFGLFYALGILQLDKTVTSLLAGVGIVGIALGFAFQEIASNFMSGVLMAVRRPFEVGDLVQSGDWFGHVADMGLRSTRLRQLSGEMVLIPNKEVYQNPVVNYSACRQRRVDLTVGVSYGDDLRKAKAVALEAVRGVPTRLPDREPELFFEGFGESSVDFTVRFWIPFEAQTDWLEARSEAVMRVHRAFDQHDITIPFPIRTLDFGIVGGTPLEGSLDRSSVLEAASARAAR